MGMVLRSESTAQAVLMRMPPLHRGDRPSGICPSHALPKDSGMTEMDSFYSPERIDQILRQWPAYESRAQGYRSPHPDALRPSKGPVVSGNVTAAICADIAQAMVTCLAIGGQEWRTVELRRVGYTFGQIAATLHVGKQTAHEAYWVAVGRMALFLGWVEEEGAEEIAKW